MTNSITDSSYSTNQSLESKSRTPTKSKQNQVQNPISKPPGPKRQATVDDDDQPKKKQKVDGYDGHVSTRSQTGNDVTKNSNPELSIQKQCDQMLRCHDDQVLDNVTSLNVQAFVDRATPNVNFVDRATPNVNFVEKETQCSFVTTSSQISSQKQDIENRFEDITNKLRVVVQKLREIETLELLNDLEKLLNILSDELDQEESVVNIEDI